MTLMAHRHFGRWIRAKKAMANKAGPGRRNDREAGSPAGRGKEREAEARRILERVDRESETIGSSGFARTADRVTAHFRADDAPDGDRIEQLGRRIGRGLGLIAFVGLAVYLFLTYVIR